MPDTKQPIGPISSHGPEVRQLLEAFGLVGKSVSEITIRIAMNEPVTVTLVRYANGLDATLFTEWAKAFVLVPKDQASPGTD